MIVRYLLILFTFLLFGCTAAVPEVSSLGASLFLASKSPNPFDQENNSGVVFISGTCTALSKSFEFRVDGITAWAPISSSAPSPGPSEWTPMGALYDTDCTDGSFNFYVFISSILSNAELHYGTLPSEYEPFLVELRTLDADGAIIPGAINFERPRPAALRLRNYHGPEWWTGILEVNQPIKFNVSLISSRGHEVKAYPTDVIVDLNRTLVGGASTLLGNFYDDDCTTLLTLDMRTFTASDRRKTFCYVPNGVSPGARIRLSISGSGLISQNHEFNIVATDSVYLNLLPFNDQGSQKIPQVLVKGAVYKLSSNLSTYENPSLNRRVNSFSGSYVISGGSSEVNYASAGINTICPATGANTFTCATASQTSAPFKLLIPPTSSLTNFELNLSANPSAPCANCQIRYIVPDSNLPIQSYQSQIFPFQVAGSSTAYSRPLVEFPDLSLRQTECRELLVSLGNSSGHTLPAPALAPTLRLQGPVGLNFSRDWHTCNTAVPVFNAAVHKMALRPDGKILAAGIFSQHGSTSRRRLAVVNPDGSLENSFQGPDTTFREAITALLPLPDGRTLVGGMSSDFDDTGSGRDFLVLLRPDGRVDTGFNFRTNGPVNSMVYDATSGLIFLAGDFTQIFSGTAPSPRNGRIGAFNYNATTGVISLHPWGSTLSINSTIYSLLVHAGKIYVGGGFSLINSSQPVNSLVRFDISAQTLEAWPTGYTGPNNTVLALDFDPNQNRVIVGGNFTSASGSGRSRVAAYDVTTGNLNSFNPNPNNSVQYVKVSGPRLYVSGGFSTIGGSARNGIARLDLTTDVIDSWDPASNDSDPYKPLLLSHEAAYIAGNFTNLGGAPASLMGRVDLITAAGMAEFSSSAIPNQMALSFSPYDLIKKIYIKAESGLIGPITLQITDGNQTVGLSFDVKGN
jgi:hypothetical protein